MSSSKTSTPPASSSFSFPFLTPRFVGGVLAGSVCSFALFSLSRRALFSRSAMSHAASAIAAATKPIEVGTRIPSGLKLQEKSPSEDKPNEVDVDSFLKGRKIVLFAIPGAFTPGCSKTHLPGYVADHDKIKGKGVAEIACIATNDPWVMSAWGEAHHAGGKVRMFSDASGEFTKALGLGKDAPGALALRSQRYSAVVEDGKLTQLNIDSGLSCSLSNNLKL